MKSRTAHSRAQLTGVSSAAYWAIHEAWEAFLDTQIRWNNVEEGETGRERGGGGKREREKEK